MRYKSTLRPCVASTIAGNFFDCIHGFALADDISDDIDIGAYILKNVLDINSPTGAFVFAIIISGIFVVFIAILDSLKPPNFPPGPRWLPFGGDSSRLCSRPLTLTSMSKLESRFGSVVGLRQNDSLRTPLILALSLESASTLEAAVKDGLLSDAPYQSFYNLTAIPSSLKNEISDIITSQKVEEILDKASFECVCDFYQSIRDIPKSAQSSLISTTVFAGLYSVVTGRRIQPTSPHLIKLHDILVKSSNLQYLCDNYQRNDRTDLNTCSSHSAQIVMALSDIEESEECKRSSYCRINILGLLYDSSKFSFSEKCAITADILIKAEIAYHGMIMRKTIKKLANFKTDGNDNRSQEDVFASQMGSATPREILTCHNLCRDLLVQKSRSQPWLQIGPRRKVLKSFFLNGFAVPKNTHVQSILSRVDLQSTPDERRCPVENLMMNLMTKILFEITSSCEFKLIKLLSFDAEEDMENVCDNYKDIY